jgi:hypothetical protein
MAFGDILGNLTGIGASVLNPSTATGSVATVTGDLIVGVFAQQTNLTVTGAGDNLGNTYTAQNAGTDAGLTTGRMFYSRVTFPGTLTTVNFTATASANNYACVATVYRGDFAFPPLNANPNNSVADITSPFTCPPTGTMTQTSQVVVGWACASIGSANWTASSGITTVSVQAVDPGGIIISVLGSVVKTTTTTVTPAFAGAAPGDDVLGAASFVQGSFLLGGMWM